MTPRRHVHAYVQQPPELLRCLEERVRLAGIQPDRLLAEGLPCPRGADHIVTREVLRVVERTGRRVPARKPQRRRMSPDRAEPARRNARKVESAEPAHRDPADGDTLRIRMRALKPGGNGFTQHVRAPRPILAVVVVAVIAARNDEQSRRARAEPGKFREQLVRQPLRRAGSSPVQQDEQRWSRSASRREDDDFVERLAEQTARKRELDNPSALRIRISGTFVPGAPDEGGDDDSCEDEPDDEACAHAREPTR